MSEVVLRAPMAAWVSPLAEVPDEAFAAELLGPGLALDPLEGLVRAPCDAEIVAVAPTGHSVTLRHSAGAELLIHVSGDRELSTSTTILNFNVGPPCRSGALTFDANVCPFRSVHKSLRVVLFSAGCSRNVVFLTAKSCL